MTDTILVLPDAPGGDALLARRTRDAVDTTRGDLDALTPLLSLPYAVILPGQRVRAFLTDVPSTVRGADRVSVARFAHEDRLAADLDSLHLVVGTGDPAPTLVVGRDVMDTLLGQFDPHHILADFDALADLAGEPLRLLDRVVQPGPQGDAVDPDWSDVAPVSYDDQTVARALFARLDGGDALNLRSGPYRRRIRMQAGPWGRVAALALLCGGLGLAATLADARATSAQADAVSERARTLYTQATGQPAPANLSRLPAGPAATDGPPTQFLDLSALLFSALSDHPETQVDRLLYEAGEGRLSLAIAYPSFEAAGALERTVAAAGGTLQSGGVREQNGQFLGDAVLSLEAGS